MSIFLVLILTIFHYFRFLSKNLLLKWDVELLLYYRNHFHVKQLSFEVVKCVMTSSILKILMVLKNNYTKKILDLFAIFKAIRAFVPITRSSHQKCSIVIVVLKNFTKFTGKQLCQSLFFNNVADLRPAILLKGDCGTGVFLWVLWNFLEHLFTEHLRATASISNWH